jgi:hypothetical protein
MAKFTLKSKIENKKILWEMRETEYTLILSIPHSSHENPSNFPKSPKN